jgi:rfaE bifunctional protein nucleotidyltransferase chain/domain
MKEKSKIIALDSFIKKKISRDRIILVGGAFDLFHLGHLKYLKEASKYGDKLVVALTVDKFIKKGVGRPYFNENQRAEMLSHLDIVDYIIFNHELSPLKIIKSIKPGNYIKGPDYKDLKNDISKNIIKEKKLVEKYGGIFRTTTGKTFSSTTLLNKNSDILKPEAKLYLSKIDKKLLKIKINKKINSIRNNNIFLVGENIVDEFTHVETRGKSQKSNILSTSFLKKEAHTGGVLMVACHLASFFKRINVLLIGQISKDIKKKLPKNIFVKTISCKNFDMVRKNRFIDYYNKTKLYQINHKDVFQLDASDQNKIKTAIKKFSDKKYKIVITDFGHGIFDENITSFVNKLKIKKYINCQTNSSNFGFNIFDKFSNSHILCIDEQEFRLFSKNRNLPINVLLKKNKNNLKSYKNFIITMGKNGCFFRDSKNKISFVPTLLNKIKDTLGSGDAFFCGMIIADQIKTLSTSEKNIFSHIFGGIHSNVFGNERYIKKEDLIFNLNHILL